VGYSPLFAPVMKTTVSFDMVDCLLVSWISSKS
jgi:hypothetical protein